MQRRLVARIAVVWLENLAFPCAVTVVIFASLSEMAEFEVRLSGSIAIGLLMVYGIRDACEASRAVLRSAAARKGAPDEQ